MATHDAPEAHLEAILDIFAQLRMKENEALLASTLCAMCPAHLSRADLQAGAELALDRGLLARTATALSLTRSGLALVEARQERLFSFVQRGGHRSLGLQPPAF